MKVIERKTASSVFQVSISERRIVTFALTQTVIAADAIGATRQVQGAFDRHLQDARAGIIVRGIGEPLDDANGNPEGQALHYLSGCLSSMLDGLNDEQQEGGPQCPTGDTFNDLADHVQRALRMAGVAFKGDAA